MQRVILIVCGLWLAGCGSCGDDGPTTRDVADDQVYDVGGEEYRLIDAVVRPTFVRSGETTLVQLALPESVTEAFVTFEEPSTSCEGEYPCSLGDEWARLEPSSETGYWEGSAEVPEISFGSATLRAEIRALGASPSRYEYSITVDHPGQSDGYVAIRDRESLAEACGEIEGCTLTAYTELVDYSGSDLEILSGVSRFEGGLVIANTPNLESFDGLQDASYFQHISVDNAPLLADVSAVEGAVIAGVGFGHVPRLNDVGVIIPEPDEIDEPWERVRVSLGPEAPVDFIPSHLPAIASINVQDNLTPLDIAPNATIELDSVFVSGSGLTSIVNVTAFDFELSNNPDLEEVEFPLGTSRSFTLTDNEKLERVVLTGESYRALSVTITNSPDLRTIEGLEGIRPPATIYLKDLPGVSRCEVEDALHSDYRDAPWLETLGPCD